MKVIRENVCGDSGVGESLPAEYLLVSFMDHAVDNSAVHFVVFRTQSSFKKHFSFVLTAVMLDFVLGVSSYYARMIWNVVKHKEK